MFNHFNGLAISNCKGSGYGYCHLETYQNRLKKPGRQMNNAIIILCYLKTGQKSNQKQKKKNEFNKYLWYTLMARICSSRFGNFFSFFFLKPNFHGNSAKGEGVGGHGAFQRALAKIHSKKLKFYTKHLTLRVYKKKKKCFIGFLSIFTQAIYQKK